MDAVTCGYPTQLPDLMLTFSYCLSVVLSFLFHNLKTKYGEISETLADTSAVSAVVGSRTASSFSGVIYPFLFIGLVLPKLPVDYG
ncbi:unnamed protein product [Brassica oleracea var. botrytis]